MSHQFDTEPGFDQRIADWLEADPRRAPSRVLETVLAAAPSIPQRRAARVPWRFLPMNRTLLAGATLAAVLAVGLGAFALAPRSSPDVGTPLTPSPSATPRASAAPSAAPTRAVDHSHLPGRILAEHLGNAIDGSEAPTTEFNPDRRRFYLLDPADMTGATATEFLPGQPATGKFAADVSSDGRKVVFQDWTEQPRLYEANLDGSGFHRLAIDCDCQLLYPDYDPSATRVVYVRIEGEESWLEIHDITSGETTPLEPTRGPADNNVPEQPAWSPDGSRIAFSRLEWRGNDPIVGTVRYGDVPPESGVLSMYELATDEVTDVPLPEGSLPGDVNWYPDGQRLVYGNGPASTTGSTAGMPPVSLASVRLDGSDLRRLPGFAGPRFLPDGSKILYQDNVFYLMDPDGSDSVPVKRGAMDLTELTQGFVYTGHWIDAP